MLSTRTWSALSVLRETVRCRVWIRVLRLRGRSLLLMVLLMYNARGSRLLKMMRRWRTLLRVVGMMVISRDCNTRFLFVSSTLSMGHVGRCCPARNSSRYADECRRTDHNSDLI
jgi:PAS domain-containing protein